MSDIVSHQDSTDPLPRAENHFDMGLTLQREGRYAEAEACYRQALAIRPDFAEVHHNLGVTLNKQGRYAEAEASALRALQLKPNDAKAFRLLGKALMNQGKDLHARICFVEAVRLTADFPVALRKLGEAIQKRSISDKVVISRQDKLNNDENNSNNTVTPLQLSNVMEKINNAIHHQTKTRQRNDIYYDTEEVLQNFKRGNGSSQDLKIVLIQPPAKKISAHTTIQDGDSLKASYGLLSIAAQLLKTGRQVLVLNLANFVWSEIEKIINYVEADLVGISCSTAFLPGVKALSQLVRTVHPQACIVVGGPHITPLPAETLNHFEAIDIAVIGEGELTFLEIVERLEADASQPPQGIAGTAWRGHAGIQFGPPRERIKNLDSLASPHDYFYTPILLTSRGCPFQCTFCGSFSQWGKNLIMNSPEYILRLLEKIVLERGQQYLVIMDDTFTANRKRILAICHQIIEKKLNFSWSCHTRVDSLDEEVLRVMRLAGCQRISLGVESGSPVILQTIKKKINPRKVVEVSRLARKYGLQVRFFMILGNRGETLETIQQSFELIHESHPFSALFGFLTIYPGTEEFEIFKKEKGIDAEIFYKEGFRELTRGTSYLPDEESKDYVKLFASAYCNNVDSNYSTIEEYIDILHRLDGHPAAHMDLAGAYLRAGQPERAKPHIFMAIELGYPHMAMALNYLAIVAAFRGDFTLVEDHFHQVTTISDDAKIVSNYVEYKKWLDNGGLQGVKKLILMANNDFPNSYFLKQPDYSTAIYLPD